jgi:hypothetical protein
MMTIPNLRLATLVIAAVAAGVGSPAGAQEADVQAFAARRHGLKPAAMTATSPALGSRSSPGGASHARGIRGSVRVASSRA